VQAGNAAGAKGKKTKKSASRGTSARAKKSAKKADAEAPQKPCVPRSVSIDRGGREGTSLTLLDCHGAPLEAARTELSVMARPWSVARPGQRKAASKRLSGAPKTKDKLAPGVTEIAPGVRVRAITDAVLRRLSTLEPDDAPTSPSTQPEASPGEVSHTSA
jgi:hypothetical protein